MASADSAAHLPEKLHRCDSSCEHPQVKQGAARVQVNIGHDAALSFCRVRSTSAGGSPPGHEPQNRHRPL